MGVSPKCQKKPLAQPHSFTNHTTGRANDLTSFLPRKHQKVTDLTLLQ
jgi:hypothetical protein